MIQTQQERKHVALDLETLQLKKAALILRAVNHKLRNQILQLIHKEGTITVTEIYVRLRLDQSVASQHLAFLRKTGFVRTQREGKKIFYSINYPRIKQVQELAKQIV